MIDDYKTAQGPAKPATPEEIAKETDPGETKPNLHRRIDNESTPLTEGEVSPDTYSLTVAAVNSYRTTTKTTYSEDSDLEIP